MPQALTSLTNLVYLDLQHNRAQKSRAQKTLRAEDGTFLTPKMEVTEHSLSWLLSCPQLRAVMVDVTREEQDALAEFRQSIKGKFGGRSVICYTVTGEYL